MLFTRFTIAPIVVIFLCCIGNSERSIARDIYTSSDSTLPTIGQPLPDFYLKRITHFRKKEATQADFKGKWLFLDFWFTGCINCIASFPKVNGFYNEFKGNLEWIMIGLNNYSHDKSSRDVEVLYEKFRSKLHLTMPAAYDSLLFKQWDIWSMPRILIVDPQGILRYMTGGRDLTREKIQALIEGKTVSLYPAGIERPNYDTIALQSAQDTTISVYHSVITRWKGESQLAWDDFDGFLQYPQYWTKGYTVSMVHLEWLYNLAFFGDYQLNNQDSYGKLLRKPILRMKDTSLFTYSYKDIQGKGLYSYQLVLPSSQINKERMMAVMQQDLKRAFNYDVAVETVKAPVWKLVVLPGAEKRLKTRGGAPSESPRNNDRLFGFSVTNFPVRKCIEILERYVYETDLLPCIDATGIEGNIDLTLEADMLSRESIIKALRKHGLDLVKDSVLMKGLIISDSRP